MRSDVAQALHTSIHDMEHTVFPILRRECTAFQQGRLMSIEAMNNSLSTLLDMHTGIDVLHMRSGHGIRGIATRVQYGEDYRSFTVRTHRPSEAQTEYGKRLASIKGEYIYPYWTLQAYLSKPGGTLLSLAVTPTKELYQYIEAYEHTLSRPFVHERQASFLVVGWHNYKQAGNHIFIYDGQQKQLRKGA
jgi:hypothetical protein